MEINLQSKPVRIVRSGNSNYWEYLREVWKHRNLILVFTEQQIKVHYVQTRLNLLWLVLRPLMLLALFTFVFDGLIHLPGILYPYPLFVLTGFLVWNNFSYMVNEAGNAIVSSQQLVKKMYFPRIILVFSKMLEGVAELVVTFVLILLLMAFLHYPLHLQILFVPFFIIMGLICGLAVAIWLSALTIRYRDLNHFVPTLVGFLIWFTPVFYPVTLIPEKYSVFIYMNPISGVIQGCRWAILNDTFPSLYFLPSFIISIVLLLIGLLIFIRAESELADLI